MGDIVCVRGGFKERFWGVDTVTHRITESAVSG